MDTAEAFWQKSGRSVHKNAENSYFVATAEGFQPKS